MNPDPAFEDQSGENFRIFSIQSKFDNCDLVLLRPPRWYFKIQEESSIQISSSTPGLIEIIVFRIKILIFFIHKITFNPQK